MTKTRFYLDTRNAEKGKPAPLKIAITKKGQAAFISLNVQILPSQWDKRSDKVVGHPNRFFLNTYITSRKQAVDTLLLKLIENGELFNMRAVDIKARIVSELKCRNRTCRKTFSSPMRPNACADGVFTSFCRSFPRRYHTRISVTGW